MDKNNNKLKMTFKIDDEEIKKILKRSNIQTDRYFIATCIKNAKEYILTGKLESDTIINYIIAFNNEEIYIMSLSTVKDKLITDKKIISKDNITIIKFKKTLFGLIYKIIIKTEDLEMKLQANKKISNFINQKSNIENFIKLYKK